MGITQVVMGVVQQSPVARVGSSGQVTAVSSDPLLHYDLVLPLPRPKPATTRLDSATANYFKILIIPKYLLWNKVWITPPRWQIG